MASSKPALDLFDPLFQACLHGRLEDIKTLTAGSASPEFGKKYNRFAVAFMTEVCTLKSIPCAEAILDAFPHLKTMDTGLILARAESQGAEDMVSWIRSHVGSVP